MSRTHLTAIAQPKLWRTGVVILLLVLSAPQMSEVSNAAQDPPPADLQVLEAEIQNLGWQRGPGTYRLNRSTSKLTLPEGMEIVQDADARRFMFLTNGTEYPATEAVVFSPVFGITVFGFGDIGYVTDDDWNDVDADALLKNISDATEDRNQERIRNGYDALHVVGWATEPRYDAIHKIAFWAIELQNDRGQTIFNSTALKLSRYGFSEITLVVPPESFAGSSANLESMLATHAFDHGHSYAEFREGDKVATFTLAALVAAVAGAKFGKGIFAALLAALVLLKKFWVVIPVVVGGVWALLRRGNNQT